MRQADTLTPDEQLRLAAHLEQRALQADPYAIIHRRRAVIEDRKEEKMLHLTAKLEQQFEESARLEVAIRENLRGLGYAS